jgi:predicted hotdog family 3-hydroxylacyl-ACP dehydratase
MVLLDEVVAHDAAHIVCRAGTHRSADHPLRQGDRLPVWAGIEYAAQAMAAHFSLGRATPGRATLGLLGALRDVRACVDRLDDVDGALLVAAERLSHDAAGSIYAFRVTGESDGRELLSGRATVVQAVDDRP